jgi:hypothetical protein
MNYVHTDRERFDERTANILVACGQQLTDLVGYLEIIADDYAAANDDYLDTYGRYEAMRQATIKRVGIVTSPEQVPPEELELARKTDAAGQKLYLRVETFYLFAKILLDQLAAFIPYYFGPGRGVKLSKHSQLKAALPVLAEQKCISLPDSLTARIDELTRRISVYRDWNITHGHSPRTFQGMVIDLATGEAKVSTHRLYPRDAAETGQDSETPNTLLPLIENYMIELFAFVATNSDKTGLATGGGAPPSPEP